MNPWMLVWGAAILVALATLHDRTTAQEKFSPASPPQWQKA